ncbi:MAG: precorrin-3B C(17)-methyltransferase [Pseudomonadota bacterium]
MAEPAPVVVCLTGSAVSLAETIAAAVGGTVHGRDGRVETAVSFGETTAHIRALFAAGHPVIGLCAAGILIRSVAPLLSDKHAEPPVLAVAENGSAVVPLLGGHHGANDLARQIATAIGITASVTTASDLSLGVALDAPPPGWRLDSPESVGPVTAALLSGHSCRVSNAPPFLNPLKELPNVLVDSTGSEGEAAILTEDGWTLKYRRTSLAVGVGCARNCASEELEALVQHALSDVAVKGRAVAGVFSLDLKADESAVLDLARRLDVPARFFSAEELEAQATRLANPSDVVFAEVGCHGVAEGAALAAGGPDAQLVVEKRKSANATVAIADASTPIVSLAGRKRGQVALIGLGPGQTAWRTPEASQLIAQADELVGYGFYIDLIGPLAKGKPRADFPLGGEEDRCRYALEQAGQGRDIALICSGDAGIYAMGALVYELLDRGDLSDAAHRVEIVTAPGITAMQAAAARIGAPMGHDFCAISLSDLLTPRADIERRVQAAADGDFVVAFYNPVSQRRRDLFVQSVQVLQSARPAETPVVLARSLGRPDEVITLRQIDEVSVDEVDMMTVVIVGSSQSRMVRVGGRDRVYTPRGYAAKHQEAAE